MVLLFKTREYFEPGCLIAMAAMGYLQLAMLCEYFNRLVYCSKSNTTWSIHKTLALDCATLALYIACLIQFLEARNAYQDSKQTSFNQNIQFNLPHYFKYESIALLALAIIKLLVQLAPTRLFGQLVLLIRSVIEMTLLFVCLIIAEIIVFVVVGIMLSPERDNSIETVLAILFNSLWNGEYREEPLFGLQISFVIV